MNDINYTESNNAAVEAAVTAATCDMIVQEKDSPQLQAVIGILEFQIERLQARIHAVRERPNTAENEIRLETLREQEAELMDDLRTVSAAIVQAQTLEASSN